NKTDGVPNIPRKFRGFFAVKTVVFQKKTVVIAITTVLMGDALGTSRRLRRSQWQRGRSQWRKTPEKGEKGHF
ncbi:hypothetical protein, partial [uncultured Parabacteroides sp.]|uniref:hypothetical protein n=1 Tax=uncultured Parabacteroides sp. TaxID=512312 RepID=UPI002594DA80